MLGRALKAGIKINLWFPVLLFLHDAGGRVIYVNALQNLSLCICNNVPFVATVAFVMYQKVHLLLDDITV